jgi:hypothetical protein
LAPISKDAGGPLTPAQITDDKNLFLLAGNIDLSESEMQVYVALSTSAAIPRFKIFLDHCAVIVDDGTRLQERPRAGIMQFSYFLVISQR